MMERDELRVQMNNTLKTRCDDMGSPWVCFFSFYISIFMEILQRRDNPDVLG